MKIPDELHALIAEGIWPRDHAASLAQNNRSVIPSEVIQRFAPDEERLFLYPPPFCTPQQGIDRRPGSFWLDPRSATNEIDPALALVIGDFGLGSDAAIILDYRTQEFDPKVLRLRWAEEGNHWVECAKTFSEFAAYLRESKSTTEQAMAHQPA
jgi:hypothetical protein